MTRAAPLLMIVALALPAAAVAQDRGGGEKAREARMHRTAFKLPEPHQPDGLPADMARRGQLSGWIDPGVELKLERQFLAGQPAAVAVRTDGATLALTVGEAGETPVCSGAGRGCRWLPAYAGRYAIRLRNGGGARVRYLLLVR